MHLEELVELLAPLYKDSINLAQEGLQKQHEPFPEDRAQRRARQLALVLRRLGWDDEEIIAYAGFATGVGIDLVWVKNLPDREPTDDDEADNEESDGEDDV